MQFPKCSLIISTYNWPQALQLCFNTILKQVLLPTEIIIVDDGSTKDTKVVIDNFRKKISVPVKHLWHEDKGFRKTIILNEAIRNSSFEYLIIIDGDIIIDKYFIKEHLENVEKGFFIRGSRTLINKTRTKKILSTSKTDLHFFSYGLGGRLSSIHSKFLYKLNSKKTTKDSVEGVIGCNFSFWKNDLIKVNGFNNDIVGWGREDSELAARLINNNIFKKHLKYQAICFHLYHKTFSRSRDEINKNYLEEAIVQKIKFCDNGYNTKHDVIVFQ